MKKMMIYFMAAICVVAACACSSNATVSNTSQSNTEATAAPEEKTTYRPGDEIFIKNSTGEYKINFTKIEETAERNQFSDVEAERVVIISYEYENISCDDDLNISDLNFKLYDKENNSLKSYPANVTYPQAVGQGRKTSASTAYALNSAENYIELEYYDNLFNSKSDCTVTFEW